MKRGKSWDISISILGIAAVVLAFGAALYLSANVQSTLFRLQKASSIARVAMVLQALNQSARHLAEYTAGSARWDDAYEFMESRDPAFLEKNYARPVLAATPVQLVGIYTGESELVFSTALNEKLESEPPPKALKDLLKLEKFRKLRDAGDVFCRVDRISKKPYLIAVCPITDSTGEEPVRGYLLFGMLIGEKMSKRLDSVIGTHVVTLPDDSYFARDYDVATSHLGTIQVDLKEGPDASMTTALALIRQSNWRESPVVFKIELPVKVREIGRELSRTIRTVSLLVAGAFTVFVGLALREIFRRRAEIQRRIFEARELDIARKRAEAADGAKSAFLAMISHEIRTPLNAIIGYANLLQRDKTKENVTEQVEIIAKSSEMLQHIINDILDLSKIEADKLSIQRRPTRVRELIGEVADSLKSASEERQNRLTIATAPEVPPSVELDDLRVRQVLGNLLSNAVKFTEGGRITISASFGAREQTQTDMEIFPDDAFMLHIAVEDEGIGVPPENEAALFSLFNQGDAAINRRYGGTGLGLVICRRLCSLMGGTVSYQRREDKGSKFEFWLPTHPVAEAETPAPQATSPAPQPSNLSLLVVDDNPINARLLKAILKSLGHEAEIAFSGQEAINLFREKPMNAVFMDIHMPEMDGLATAKALRKLEQELSRPRCLIAAVTADTLVTDSEKSLTAGMDAHINKPVKISEIEHILNLMSSRK